MIWDNRKDREKADKAAFVEDYLELCRKYGRCLDVYGDYCATIYITKFDENYEFILRSLG